MFPSVVAAFVLSLPLFAAAEHAGRSRRHNSIAISKRNTTDIEKRGQTFNNARLTFYSTGLGACGQVNHDGDFIVALNTPQFTELGNSYPSPQCFKRITITSNGKTTGATIMDECPGCPFAGLDLSPGLFSFFAPQSVGVLSASWSFDDGSGGGNNNPPPPPPPPPKKTSHTPPPPPPTTTHEKPTSTPPSPPSTTKASSTKASSSSSSSHSHSHSSSSTPAPKPTQVIGGTPDKPENLQGLGYLVVQLGNLVLKNN